MADFSVVGVEGQKDKTIWGKLTGQLDYADDRMPGRKLFARALLSPHARADVINIDISAAEALPGVKGVITFEDCPALTSRPRHWGAEIAAVAAVDSETAARAVELIEVEYDVGEQISDPEEAMEPGAPLTGIWEGTNIRTSELNRGDIETGFAEADQEFEFTVGWTNFWQHKELEPRAAVCHWVGDNLYVWTTSQNPFGQRNGVAGNLIEHIPGYDQPGQGPSVKPMPLHKVHLISHGSGSGHGDKHYTEWIVIAACLADKTHMPVSYHLNRMEHMCGQAVHQFPGKLEMRIGVKDDGTITAMDTTWYCNATSAGATRAAGFHHGLRYTFKCPHARFATVDIAANIPKSGPFRCVADPPGDAMYNVALDKVADALGMNPLEFRLKNLVTQDMLQYETQMPFSSLGIRQCFEEAAAAIGWDEKWHEPGTRTLPDGRLHGLGISGHVDSHGQMSGGVGAILNLTSDGKCLIAPGQSHCAGSIIAHCHHAAEVLGMKYEDINVAEWGNTDVTSEGGSEGGSTRCITLGSAYYEAALDARNQVFEIIAEFLDTTPDNLSARDGLIFETGNQANSMSWAEAASRFPHPIVGRGYSWPKTLKRPVLNWPAGTPCEVRGQLASAVEIAVDPDTGHIEVLNKTNAIDCGKAIYLSGFNKGTYGGCEIQHGETLNYEQVIDYGNGATLNANMWQNSHVTSMDIDPTGYTAIAVETDDACGPHGCKGVGEPQVSAIASTANAFYNATGVWVDSLPITPDKVLQALGKA